MLLFAASAMEMSAIAAHNSALLVQQHLFGRISSAKAKPSEGSGAGATVKVQLPTSEAAAAAAA